jgi:hypothetical protein
MPYGKAIITNFGWVVEMRIPMLLCAFLQKTNLGLNFFREINDPDKINFIDSKLGTFTTNWNS